MLTRSRWKLDMSREDISKVSHSVTNFRSGLTPFAGRINGLLQQPVEVFIDSIEAHLANKSVTDPVDQLREVSVHLDLVKGDLGVVSRSKAYWKCTTWDDLKQFLRDRYGSAKTQNIVTFLRSMFKLLDRKSNSFLNQNALINNAVIEFVKRLSNSDWIYDEGGPNKQINAISMDNLETLLLLSFGMGTLPDELVGHFDAEFDHESDETMLLRQIEKHISKMQWIDHSILQGKKAEKHAPRQVTSTTNQSSNRTQRKSF